jgi:hypothetical protein
MRLICSSKHLGTKLLNPLKLNDFNIGSYLPILNKEAFSHPNIMSLFFECMQSNWVQFPESILYAPQNIAHNLQNLQILFLVCKTQEL